MSKSIRPEPRHQYEVEIKFKGIQAKVGTDEETGEQFVTMLVNVSELPYELFRKFREATGLRESQVEEIARLTSRFNMMNSLMEHME